MTPKNHGYPSGDKTVNRLQPPPAHLQSKGSATERRTVLTAHEVALVFMALQDLREHFPTYWPDEVTAAALKVCSMVERTGPVASVGAFVITGEQP